MDLAFFRANAQYTGRFPQDQTYGPVCWYYLDGTMLIDSGTAQGGAQAAAVDSLIPQVTHIVVNRGLGLLKRKPFACFPNLESVTLSEQVARLDWHSFEDCKSLKKVTLPAGITAIPSYAFYRCAALEEVNIPDSVTVFGEFAFCGCSSLNALHIPAELTAISRYALSGCAAFEQGLLSFDHCPKLKSVPKPGLNLPVDNSCEVSGDDDYFFGDAWRDIMDDN